MFSLGNERFQTHHIAVGLYLLFISSLHPQFGRIHVKMELFQRDSSPGWAIKLISEQAAPIFYQTIELWWMHSLEFHAVMPNRAENHRDFQQNSGKREITMGAACNINYLYSPTVLKRRRRCGNDTCSFPAHQIRHYDSRPDYCGFMILEAIRYDWEILEYCSPGFPTSGQRLGTTGRF